MTYTSAMKAVREPFSQGLLPDPPVIISEWAEEVRIVSEDASPHPGPWRNALTPYLVEIMDCLSPDYPANEITLRKPAQSGGSEVLTNWLGAMIDRFPGPSMVVHPTVESGKDWNAEKLEPTIHATPALAKKVLSITSRDGRGSTTKRKRFPGGFLLITGANSTRGLRQHSVKYIAKDEWSDWPFDVDGQGDPDGMADARQIAFHETGAWKQFRVSTPTIKGVCRISKGYEASDQRRYFVPCPACGHEQDWHFFPDGDGRGGLRFNTEPPYDPHYACEECGYLIAPHEKRKAVAEGHWIKTKPGAGREPGFHYNALISNFTTWEQMAKVFLRSKDDPAEYKTFVNLWLAEAWEERGDAPAWEKLQKRAEDYPLGVIPAGGLVLVMGCDVQKTGVYYEIVAYGEGKESWSVDYGFLEGDTAESAETGQIWKDLTTIYERDFPDTFGGRRKLDMLAIDSGYNTNQVYGFVRGKPYAMAVKGTPGWKRGVLGTAEKQGVTYAGKKRRKALKVWPVYVWSLKGEFYANLRKAAPEPGNETYQPGYCHFSTGHSGVFYQQLTADYLKERSYKGRTILEWTTQGENHWHDCRIYTMAAFQRAAMRWGIQHGDPHAWAKLKADREKPVEPEQGKLAIGAGSQPADLPQSRNEATVVPRPSATRPPKRGFVKRF